MKIRLKKVEDSMRIKKLVNSSQQYWFEHLTAHASASRHEWEELQCRWTEENQAEINSDYPHKNLASVVHKRESSPEEGEFFNHQISQQKIRLRRKMRTVTSWPHIQMMNSVTSSWSVVLKRSYKQHPWLLSLKNFNFLLTTRNTGALGFRFRLMIHWW